MTSKISQFYEFSSKEEENAEKESAKPGRLENETTGGSRLTL